MISTKTIEHLQALRGGLSSRPTRVVMTNVDEYVAAIDEVLAYIAENRVQRLEEDVSTLAAAVVWLWQHEPGRISQEVRDRILVLSKECPLPHYGAAPRLGRTDR